MINREIRYERNLTGSFMKIAAGIHMGLDEKLMLKKKLPGLLPVEKVYVDGDGQYWYNISGKQSLDTYCRVKEIGMEFIEKLIISICSEMEILEWNLMQTSCLMLDPELIFITSSNHEIIFTVYPGTRGTVEAEFQQLMEYLLTKIDHKDAHAVRAAYGIDEKTLREGDSIREIREEILHSRQEQLQEMQAANAMEADRHSLKMYQKREDKGNKRSVEEEPHDIRSQEEKRWSKPGRRQPDLEKSEWKEKGAQEQKNGRTKKRSIRKEKSSSGINGIRKLKTFLVELGILEPETEEMVQKPVEEKRKPRKKQETEVVYPEEEMLMNPEPQYRPTVCLNSAQAIPKGMLLYQGRGAYDDICVTDPITRIGYGPDADAKIPSDTISQMHARIDHEEEAYYIEDLNSTNGTYVNGEALAYKERRKLKSNDIIRFAEVKYRFC